MNKNKKDLKLNNIPSIIGLNSFRSIKETLYPREMFIGKPKQEENMNKRVKSDNN